MTVPTPYPDPIALGPAAAAAAHGKRCTRKYDCKGAACDVASSMHLRTRKYFAVSAQLVPLLPVSPRLPHTWFHPRRVSLSAPSPFQDVIPEDKQPELLDTISKGNVTMRVLKDMFESVLELGPMSQVGGWGNRQAATGNWKQSACSGGEGTLKGTREMQVSSNSQAHCRIASLQPGKDPSTV